MVGMEDEALPVSRQRYTQSRLVVAERKEQARRPVNLAKTSLLSLCQEVIVTNLERYPPEAFGIVSEDEFDELIRLRHKKTQPKEGSGGLDGTGRVAPAVSDRILQEIETSNPHLQHSQVVDQLVWKDCVEYRFRPGLTRPRALMLPWPLLVQRVQEAATSLQALNNNLSDAGQAVQVLQDSPMSVSLLQATGVGKIVKKILKAKNGEPPTQVTQQLERLLDSWKTVAAKSGVAMDKALPAEDDLKDDPQDLELVQCCLSWRALFHALQQREEQRRSNQGKRMREIRKNLASDRPKIVKVRPTKAKHARILSRPTERSSAMPQNNKISALRKEASVVASRQRGNGTIKPQKGASSFGAAVAFCAVSKKKTSSPKVNRMALAGGRQLQVPQKVSRGASEVARQLAAKSPKKWK